MQIRDHQQSYYERIGGEAVLRNLVRHFYEHMDSLTESQAIRAMHGSDLNEAENKLFMFLSGWMGAPALYIEKFGHPRLRMRHIHFKIDASARDQWMLCMQYALNDTVDDQILRTELMQALYGVADFMRNRP